MGRLNKTLRTIFAYPGYALMRSVARIDPVRNAIASIQVAARRPLASYLRTLGHRRSSFFAQVDAAALAGAVDRDGYSLGLTLPPSVVGEVVALAQISPCWADRDPNLGFFPAKIEQARAKLGRQFLLAQYFNARWRFPLIAQLAKDPVLLEIAARYLKSAPKLVGVNLWWSYPASATAVDRSNAAQMFHFDLDDFRFIKFFFYLTDVDAGSGPHVIVRGSHRVKHHASLADVLKVRRYSDEEVVATFGAQQLITVTGKAGTGFIEDTVCIHKGETPTAGARLVLQLQYALNDYGIQHDDVDESKLAMIV